MAANYNNSKSSKKESPFSNSNIRNQNVKVEKTSNQMISSNNTTTPRGLIYLKQTNEQLPPPSEEMASWPSIGSSNKVSNRSGNKKKQLSFSTKPLPQNISFKSVLCGNSLITSTPQHIPFKSNSDNLEKKSETEDVNENVWISVSHKKRNKTEVSQEDTDILNNSQQTNDNTKKKEQLKLKKILKREQKAIEERELKRKDTRINVVSQDVIDSYLQQGSHNSIRSSVPKHISFQASNNNSTTVFLQNNASSVVSNKKSLFKKGNEINSMQLLNQKMIGKKNVKTKDMINLNIIDLIKKKKTKSITLNRLPKREKIIIKEKPGKQSDIKKTKKTKLKKTILREKKISQENFAIYLAEIFQENLKISEEEVTTASITEPESPPVTATVKESNENKILATDQKYEQYESTIPLPDDEKVETILKKVTEIEDTGTDSQLKSFQIELVKEINFLCNPLHSRKFREYCTHFITEEINVLLTEFLELIVKFQIRLYENDPMKGKAKRRFYCGLKESWKHVNKLTCVVVAPDIKCNAGAGGLDELLKNIIEKAEASNVSVIFGLNQRKLGKLTRRKCSVSCIGITNFQGAQEVHKKLMNAVLIQKEKYHSAKESLAEKNINKNLNPG